MQNFKNSVAVITGAGSGFGKEFSKEAHKRGMRLFLADINKETLEKTAEEIRAQGGTVKTCVTDVSLESDINKMIDEAMAEYGQINLLINNAGVSLAGVMHLIPTQDWKWCFEVNCMSQVYAMKKIIPIMKEQKSESHIVNVNSFAGLCSFGRYMSPYFATKHFNMALSEAVYYDLQNLNYDIKMSVFCPSFVKTNLYECHTYRPERFQNLDDPYYKSDIFQKVKDGTKESILNGQPMDRLGEFLFDAIAKDEFYILPHKEGKILVEHRFKNIIKERIPNAEFGNAIMAYNNGDKSIKNIATIAKLK